MMSLIRRILHIDTENDTFSESTARCLEEHEKAIAENLAVHETSQHSTAMLENAVLLSQIRSRQFADFETSIKEKRNHARQIPG